MVQISDIHQLGEEVIVRPFVPADATALKQLHNKIFPVNYDESFFECTTHHRGVIGWCACLTQRFAPHEGHIARSNGDQLVIRSNMGEIIGFITAKEFEGRESIPPGDIQLLNVDERYVDTVRLCYVLTLGVAEEYRKKGIASRLLRMLEQHAIRRNCCMMYLHVIDYNEAAKKFYSNFGFECVTVVKDFYYINTGRALFPDKKDFDASVFKKSLSYLESGCGEYRLEMQSKDSLQARTFYTHQNEDMGDMSQIESHQLSTTTFWAVFNILKNCFSPWIYHFKSKKKKKSIRNRHVLCQSSSSRLKLGNYLRKLFAASEDLE